MVNVWSEGRRNFLRVFWGVNSAPLKCFSSSTGRQPDDFEVRSLAGGILKWRGPILIINLVEIRIVSINLFFTLDRRMQGSAAEVSRKVDLCRRSVADDFEVAGGRKRPICLKLIEILMAKYTRPPCEIDQTVV